jgi:pyruvate dehydrogenase E1 component alpha subunit
MAVVRSTAVANVADRASAYAIPGVIVDGNDFAAVAEAAFAATDRGRAGEGPTLIEAKTYRTRGHSRSDRNRYRSREEIDAWRARDPIARFEAEIIALGLANAARVEEIAAEVEKEMADAVAGASAAPWPDPAEVGRDVYSEFGNRRQ